MSIIGSSWKEESDETLQEEYREIMGYYPVDDLRSTIEKDLENLYTQRLERERLYDLKVKLQPNE